MREIRTSRRPCGSPRLVAAGIFLAFVVVFAIRSRKAHGRLVARDRWAAIPDFAMALVVFALAAMLIDRTVAPAALWLVADALLPGGVLGAALRWSGLAWHAGTRVRGRGEAGGVVATLCFCALIIGAAVS